MNLKLVLAAALFISSGTFVAQAQTKTAAVKSTTSTAAKAFDKKVNAYKAEANADKAAILFRELTNDMSTGMASAKNEIATAASDAQREAATAKYTERMNAMNESAKLFRTDATNKTAIAASLSKYAKTL